MCSGDILPFLARGTNDKYLLANGTPKKYNALDYFLIYHVPRASVRHCLCVAVCDCVLAAVWRYQWRAWQIITLANIQT
jgi:hypothetical protein